MRRHYRVICAILAAMSLLSGCEFVFNNEHVSIQPHEQQASSTQKAVIEVSNSTQLYNAIVDLVESVAQQGILSVEAFSGGSLHFYVEQAIQQAKKNNPMCAYAVDHIGYEIGTRSGKEAVALTIQYRYELSHILRLPRSADVDGAISILEEAMEKCEEHAAVRVTQYEQTDIAYILDAFAYAHADRIMESPVVNVNTYPNTGDERIISVYFTYKTDTDELLRMQSAVEPFFTAAELYVRSASQVREKYAQLYAFLMERSEYEFEPSQTPAYSLLVDGRGDCEAFARVYAAMCREAGLECYVLQGTRNGEPWIWNVINFRDGYYHLDLLSNESTDGFAPKQKSEMEGYTWEDTAFEK